VSVQDGHGIKLKKKIVLGSSAAILILVGLVFYRKWN
jgi:hypothetical protein